MARSMTVAAAQLGAIPEGTSREEMVDRMLVLLEGAIEQKVDVVAYPELALTPYFPKRIRNDYDQFFETEMPPKCLEPLLRRAGQAGVACHIGFAEKAGDRYFNTAILTDERGALAGTYRKIHLPGTTKPDGHAQVYEPYFFSVGDTGFRVFPTEKAQVGIAVCQDRRFPESYRSLGILGAEVVLIGYNTPISPLALDLNELSMRAGAYQNNFFVVGVAKAGLEDGVEFIAGSCIINPMGQVIAKASTTGDELVVARLDLDQMLPARKRWNFLGRRRPEHYGLMTRPVPPEMKG
jgi:predicted amidohydrolase